MANYFNTLATNIASKLVGKNIFNQAFFQYWGGGYTNYDVNNKTYLDKGYNMNPDVYACVNQMAIKTQSVPYCVKKIDDKQSYAKLNQLNVATKGLPSFIQQVKKLSLESKAYSDKELPFPMESPNATQTWSEVWALYKTYMKTIGNCYFYILSPEDGMNAGVPVQFYVLPAHLMQIVLKANANMLSIESPIDHYILIDGNQMIKFENKDIIHIKYSNPNFDLNGEHLYGMSPLRSALRNINSQNSAIDLNIKTLQNGGAFGFIHGKSTPLTSDQAQSLKERLQEMDASPERLSRIAGSSAEVGFTRISLTTDELKPFEYLAWDRKSICNVLGYPDELLNNDGKASLGNTDTNEARKQLITDNILPDLKLLESALNKYFLPRFKGYENTVIEWDVTELPEMQSDMKDMLIWMKDAPVTPNEMRTALKYETLNEDGMDVVWMQTNKQRIDDVSAGVMDSNA
jgi:HK97 family phage portal protein